MAPAAAAPQPSPPLRSPLPRIGPAQTRNQCNPFESLRGAHPQEFGAHAPPFNPAVDVADPHSDGYSHRQAHASPQCWTIAAAHAAADPLTIGSSVPVAHGGTFADAEPAAHVTAEPGPHDASEEESEPRRRSPRLLPEA